MKKRILLLACLCITGMANAQEKGQGVAIGIPLPDASAALHVQSDTQGLLIPNVTITDVTSNTPIGESIKESLLVYNKKGGTVPAGYYYWVATNATTGKWVRVITSEDAGEILNGQVQESFIEEMVDDGTGKMIGTGIFVYTPDKKEAANPNAPGRLKLDIPDLVKKNQTLTVFDVKETVLYNYRYPSGVVKGFLIKKTEEEISAENLMKLPDSKELALSYVDESQEVHLFLVKDLLGAGNEEIPAITNLKIDSSKKGLIYTNDKGVDIDVSLDEVVANLETRTRLELTTVGDLIYYDERSTPNSFSLRSIVKEPWYVADTGLEASSNKENIFTEGWVGVGLKPSEAKIAMNNLKPDEKLRVNGSIYARNSYYADYVFENYFTKETSSLKYDYNFKDLATVESFIKANYHLPGITPIGELDKSAEEGYLINVSELSIQLLEKVEELYLHTIDQNKLIQKQAEQLEIQENRLREIETYLKNNK